MKTLSLLQPWATLVVIGAKRIETRRWTTGYRGTILIHASMGMSGKVLAGHAPFAKYINDFNELPFGAIIGEATLVDIVKTEELDIATDRVDKLTLEERAFGDYTGRYAWLLEDAVQYRHLLPAKGQLGLWEYPDDLYDQERNRLI